MEQVNAVSTAVVEAHPTMNWGAIFAGWLVAVGTAGLLYVGGLALGFSAFDANNAAATAKGIGMGSAGWVILTWAASLFVGGMFASWFDGKDDTTMGTMHGVTVWGLAVAASGLLLAFGAGNAMRGGAALAAGGMRAATDMHAMPMGHRGQVDDMTADATAVLRAQLEKTVRMQPQVAQNPLPGSSSATDAAQPVPGAAMPVPMDPQRPMAMPGRMDAVAVALMKGNTETAKSLLMADTSLSSADADRVLQSQSAQVEKFKADAKVVADKVARYTAMTLWIAFLSSLLGLIFAAIGGWLGSQHIHRVYHLRMYARTPRRSTATGR